MGDKDSLKSMITNMIDDKNTEASVDFHNYLKSKMADVVANSGQSQTQQPTDKKTGQ